MLDQTRALRKFVLSFRKREWTIDDYPVKVTDHGPVEAKGRLKPSRWTAQIINWLHMRGDADTREGALRTAASTRWTPSGTGQSS